jgi:ribosomal protein L7Ae-like RNA K-turn-binding protein
MDMAQSINIAGLLGLARRAGKLILGADGVETAIRQSKIRAVIVAEDASKATASTIMDLAQKHSVPFFMVYSKDQLGELMGRRELAVMGITDPSFADGICKYFDQP